MEGEYYMGTDDGGYDGNTFTICVMRHRKNGHTTVEYLKSTHDRKFWEQEIYRLQKWHKIPEKHILQQEN